MKKKFYIKDWWALSLQENKPFYFKGYYSDGNWTTDPSLAKPFETEQETIWAIEVLIKEEPNIEVEIITVYY